MNLTVNGEARALDGATTVAALVDEIGCGTKGVAVAVNDEVVPRRRGRRARSPTATASRC